MMKPAGKYPSDETLSEVLSVLPLGTVKVESEGSSMLSKELFWENPILANISFFQNRASEPIMVRTITTTQLGVIYLTAMKPILTLRYSQGNIKKPRLFMKGFW